MMSAAALGRSLFLLNDAQILSLTAEFLLEGRLVGIGCGFNGRSRAGAVFVNNAAYHIGVGVGDSGSCAYHTQHRIRPPQDLESTRIFVQNILKTPANIRVLGDIAADIIDRELAFEDDKNVAALAGAILTGHFTVLECPWRKQDAPSTQGESGPAFPLSERKPRATTTAPARQTDPPTFAAGLDVNAQVAGLTAAALDGVPFCME